MRSSYIHVGTIILPLSNQVWTKAAICTDVSGTKIKVRYLNPQLVEEEEELLPAYEFVPYTGKFPKGAVYSLYLDQINHIRVNLLHLERLIAPGV